jgi:hypothetical protein
MSINALNERIKHEYFGYLKEAKQLSEHSVDAVAKALDRFERLHGAQGFQELSSPAGHWIQEAPRRTSKLVDG